MNYILIMTEGSDEQAFINVLLNKKILKFKREELLMEEIYHARQITGELVGFIQLLPSSDTVSIYRIGDKLSDELSIPKSILKSKISKKFDISTTPEFEILFILNERLYDEYLKEKSFKKPSVFYKERNKNTKNNHHLLLNILKICPMMKLFHLSNFMSQNMGTLIRQTN